MNEEYMKQVLPILKEVFDSYGVVFWLDFGTLLGAYREHGFIPGDTDVDLGVYYEQLNKLIDALRELRKHIEFVVEPLSFRVGIVRLTFAEGCGVDIGVWRSRNGKFIELFQYWERPLSILGHVIIVCRHFLCSDLALVKNRLDVFQRVCHGFLPKLPLKIRKFLDNLLGRLDVGYGYWLEFTPKRFFNQLRYLKFFGLNYLVPDDFIGYLTYNYGPDFMTPNPAFHWETDQKSDMWLVNGKSSFLYEGFF